MFYIYEPNEKKTNDKIYSIPSSDDFKNFLRRGGVIAVCTNRLI